MLLVTPLVHRWPLIAVLLAGCFDNYSVTPAVYAEYQVLPKEDRRRTALLARDEDEQRQAWLRADRAHRFNPKTLKTSALRRVNTASAGAVLMVFGAGVLAGGAALLNYGLHYQPPPPDPCPPRQLLCGSFDIDWTAPMSDFFGGVLVVLGVGALVGSTAVLVTAVRKGDAEVSGGRRDMIYLRGATATIPVAEHPIVEPQVVDGGLRD